MIKDVDFICYDYNNLNLENVDVVYCDPPYQNTKQYVNSKDFDYNSFWNTMRLWSENNGVVLISELNAPDDFECIWEKSVSRSIKVTDKSVAVEKLFKYKY